MPITRKRRSFSWTGVLVLILAMTLGLPAAADHLGGTELDFHQSQFQGMTAGELVEAGLVSNEVEGCGELAPGEVGWAFLVPGNASSNYFNHFKINFDGDHQEWATDDNPGDATRVRTQKGNVTLLAFTTDADNALTDWNVFGQQDDNRFVLTHVCVPDEPEGSILIEKQYATAPDGDQISQFTVSNADGVVGTMDPTIVDDTTVLYCLGELLFGDYTISETFTPDGFIPADDINVTVDTESTCAERLAEADPALDATIDNVTLPRDLEVQKLKLSHDGDVFVETNTPLAGFEYTLYEGPDDTGTVKETSTTGNDGMTDFSEGILDVGQEYTVCETGVPSGQEGYWTAPSDHGYNDCETFTAQLNQDESFTFYNAPRADIHFGFTDVTSYASLTIICTDANGVEVINETFTGTDSVEKLGLDLGDYTCDIEIRNGEAS